MAQEQRTPETAPQPAVDQDLNLSLGRGRMDKKWKNQTMSWSDLLARLQQPTQTQETVAEYGKMTKERQTEVKDVGGFVGGFLKGGRRAAGHVQSRSLLTLDIDYPVGDLWDAVQLILPNAAAVYSTHHYSAERKRLRLLVPLAHPVTPDEYEPLARKVAEEFGMDLFDDTTYQPERLMFWPSYPRDGEYEFHWQDGAWLDPDEWLARYPDWRDSSYWPESTRSTGVRARQAKKAGDPLAKPGIIGAFCRTYSIEEAIEKFLGDVYAPTSHPDRYTFIQGSTYGGLVLYDDKFAYSHHSTDPVGDQLTNAWDLVRIHKFGDLDEDVTTKNINKTPSSKAMREWVLTDEPTRRAWQEDLTGIKLDEAKEDFAEPLDDDDSGEERLEPWLEVDGNGNPNVNTYQLALHVLRDAPVEYNGTEFLRYDAGTGVWRPDAEEYLKAHLTNHYLMKLTKINIIRETVAAVQGIVLTSGPLPEPDPDKIVLANGVYDLKQDSFTRGFDPDIHARVAHPVKYDADAEAPVFEGFVEHLFGPDTAQFVYEWFGYNFYQKYTYQAILFLYGKGGAGKSTLINLMQAVLGPESYSAVSLKAFMTQNFAAKNLYRKTANFDSDAKPEYLGDGSTLKMLTGEDMVYADVKYGEPLNFYNYAKLTFAMNKLPAMRDFTGGLSRRAVILTLNHKLTADEKKQWPKREMLKELPGIFNIAMAGLRRLLADGPTVTDDMRLGLDKWLKANDQVGRFVDDMTAPDEAGSISGDDLYTAYQDYSLDSGEKTMGRYKFFERMEELGYKRQKKRAGGKRQWVWQGLKLIIDDFD